MKLAVAQLRECSAADRQRLSATTGGLRDILVDSIRATADQLDLLSHRAPSSTVAVVRQLGSTIDTLLPGDSTIVVGGPDGSYTVSTDNRLDGLDLDETRRYRKRLSEGSGYDETHRHVLRSLQHEQLRYRNRPNGYWTAEADPIAAEYAITSIPSAADVPWMALATDGAAERIPAVGASWDQVAACDSDMLNRLLERCHHWEADTDPSGRIAPRAKRHDDKSLVVAIL